MPDNRLTRTRSSDLKALTHRPFWVLQCNPDYFAISEALVERRKISWPVSRLWDEIRVGDGAFIWVAGRDAGLYAVGRIDAPAGYLSAIPDRQLWRMTERFRNRKFVVVELLSVLDQPLKRGVALADPILREMNVVRTPMGSAFRVSEPQKVQVLRLIGISAT